MSTPMTNNVAKKPNEAMKPTAESIASLRFDWISFSKAFSLGGRTECAIVHSPLLVSASSIAE